MRTRVYIVIISLVLLAFAGCKEDNPGVILTKPPVEFKDTFYMASLPDTPQSKNALVEDFTGVRCSNCPKGHHAIEQMRSKYPGRVMAFSIHGKNEFFQFTTPYTGYEDFRVEYTAQIYNILGGVPSGLPFGAIDRVDKSSTADNWESFVVDRMSKKTPVNLYIEKEYEESSRLLKVKLKAVFTDTMSTRPYFSVGITESGMISLQKDEELANDPIKKGFDTAYVHNNVLRFMPAFKEELLPPASVIPLPEKNRVVEKTFSTTLDPKWKPENCRIVFLVHRDVEILQVIEQKVK